MKKIPFTQYLRPSGKQVPVNTMIGDDTLAGKVDEILAAGYEFTCEAITPGIVAFTISDSDLDYVTEISSNDANVMRTIEHMIRGFDFEVAKAMKQQYLEDQQ